MDSSSTRWKYQYHIVFMAKYQKKALYTSAIISLMYHNFVINSKRVSTIRRTASATK